MLAPSILLIHLPVFKVVFTSYLSIYYLNYRLASSTDPFTTASNPDNQNNEKDSEITNLRTQLDEALQTVIAKDALVEQLEKEILVIRGYGLGAAMA